MSGGANCRPFRKAIFQGDSRKRSRLFLGMRSGQHEVRHASHPLTLYVGEPQSARLVLDLARMLAVFRSLALMHAAATGGGATVSPARRAARMLVQWPNNLHAALRAVVPSAAEGRAAGRMRQQLEGVYRTWLKNVSAAADIAFLREALAGFEDAQDAGAVTGLAVEGTQGQDHVPARAASKRRAPRVAASSRRSLRCSEPGQRSYGARDAARRFGMTVSVLKFLRQDGHFAVRHQASRAAAFHELDIEAFESSWPRFGQGGAAGRPPGEAWVGSLCPEAQVRRPAAGKGELLAACWTGELPSLGWKARLWGTSCSMRRRWTPSSRGHVLRRSVAR